MSLYNMALYAISLTTLAPVTNAHLSQITRQENMQYE